VDFLSNLIRSFAPAAAPEEEVPEQDYEGADGQVCPACQRVNPPAQALCSFCRAPLAFLLESTPESGELVLIPDFYQPLFQACHAVAKGEMSPEDWSVRWESVVQQLESMAQSVQHHLQKLPAKTPDRSRIAGLVEEVLAGIENALQALETMALYLENHHPECLNRGWMQLVAATPQIQYAAARLGTKGT